MRAVDTDVLVRLVVRDDPAQTHSADRFIEHGAWAPVLAVAEFVRVLESVYDFDAAAQMVAIEMLLDHRDLTLQDADTVAQALELFRSTLRANMTETSCVTAISEQGGKENQHGNDERFCSARYGCDGRS
jgi:predicted nucleic-acid-binding protein